MALMAAGCGGSDNSGAGNPPAQPPLAPVLQVQQATSRLAFLPDGTFLQVFPHENRIAFQSSPGVTQWEVQGLGAGLGQFNFPTGAVSGPDGFYVVDSGNGRIQVISTSGVPLRQFVLNPTSFSRGVALDAQGNVYVSDGPNHQIVVFDATGQVINQFGSLGSDPGLLNYPTGLAFTSLGELLVADSGNDRIAVFLPDGTFVRTFGEAPVQPEELHFPRFLTVDSQGLVYATDAVGDDVQIYDDQGVLVGVVSGLPDGFQPVALALAPNFTLWVTGVPN